MRGTSVAVAALLSGILVLAGAAPQKSALPENYRKWLEEDVVYIITPLERDVFLKLQTDRERDLFIEAFWKHRDPSHGAGANTFKSDHYKRIEYANRYFGRTAPMPGWKTDRGRIYIILGEPGEIQRFPSEQGLYPIEVWFYQNKANLGLDTGFYVVFFQEHGQGDLRLYSPSNDGPQALLAGYAGDPSDYMTAYQKIKDLQPSLADVSLSLIPGEGNPSLGRPTLASDMLIQRIENVPRSQVEEKYAQKFLEFKDSVEVEYSANYVDSDSLMSVLRDPSGVYFVHYAVEPKRLSVNGVNDKYYANLRINGTVSDLAGKLIFQFDRTANLALDASQVRSADRMPFDFHDMFPLIPGSYKISILLKNDASKEFTSVERTVVIPGASPAVQMTAPILGYRTAPADAGRRRLKPFQLGATQIYCQPGRIFSHKDTLAVGFQLFGLAPAQAAAAAVRYVFSRAALPGQQAFPPIEKTRPWAEYGEAPNILESFPLADFPAAHYTLKVIVAVAGRDVVSAVDEFDVSHQPDLPRPWFYSRLEPEATDPVFDRIIGTQLLNSGRPQEARGPLERALQWKPDADDAALPLAQTYLALGEIARIPRLLAPFLAATKTPKYEAFELTGQAYAKLGEYVKAVGVLEQAVSRFGVNAALLNAIGDGYLHLEKPKEALAALEKSLELNPQQPDIRAKVAALKEKK